MRIFRISRYGVYECIRPAMVVIAFVGRIWAPFRRRLLNFTPIFYLPIWSIIAIQIVQSRFTPNTDNLNAVDYNRHCRLGQYRLYLMVDTLNHDIDHAGLHTIVFRSDHSSRLHFRLRPCATIWVIIDFPPCPIIVPLHWIPSHTSAHPFLSAVVPNAIRISLGTFPPIQSLNLVGRGAAYPPT